MDNVVEVTGKLVLNSKAREWCKLPYPNHPHGCPNYNKKDTCPPKVPFLQDIFDLQKPHWFVYTTFDLDNHKAKMKAKHPHWTERQCACVLYWQPKVNKELKDKAKLFLREHRGTTATSCPEAMGVDVISTLKAQGLPISGKFSDLKTVYKAIFVGYPK